MPSLSSLRTRSPRTVVGLMSGTSLDGVDAVVVHLDGSGPALEMEMQGFVHRPYSSALRDVLLRNSVPDTSSVRDLTRLNARLATVYAEAVDDVLGDAGIERTDLDLVGSHGQTVQHLPDAEDCAGASVRSTLQIGDPSALAQHLDVPVVGNFRAADVALGGQGAPLAPYFDYVAFTAPDASRGLLNLGGIANLTLLPAGADPEDVRAFDTGPANMVIDALAERLFDEPYDPDGTHADAGIPDHDLLADLLMDDYFQRPPPKSTGREHFGSDFVDDLLRRAKTRDLSPDDLLATATLLTASSVYKAYAQHIRAEQPLDALIASGGGVHNDTIMRMLTDAFAPIPVHTTGRYGVDPDAKEALCFAVLAHETVNGVPSSLPSVTGASRSAILGSLSVP